MFISLEGPEGSGKTSQMAALVAYLRQVGYPVLATREPGGTSIGDQVRTVLLTNLDNKEMHPRTEILLFQASRAQLVEQLIRPALAEHQVVLCDRYADSTLAYQGYGHQVNLVTLRAIVDFATGGLKPDLTLLLDIEVEEGLRRRSHSGKWDRLDGYELDFHQRVRAGYLELMETEPQRWVCIDASQPFERVQSEMRTRVLERLQRKLSE